MNAQHYLLLYVDSPATSANFYSRLLDKPPIELQPTFALFILDSGVKLGLWSRHTVEPAAEAAGGGGELGFSVADKETVDTLYTAWTAQGLRIAQEPIELDFGYTFVALDPDGHRLRVFALSE
ncbi:drug:proton antiporter [Pseudomonas sp. FW306-02-F02-AA]|uniref:Drug:proton antiporter n=1 Tax=Pseudomonas fluorescens TaxID=294 RepID=A0A0N9VIH5_PSEFL|nr:MULTISPECIES: VOC family protein [Pseudomonas]ALH99629.1 drug:proton antiporter [Pseudomonas fluorescens]PMZ04726.1 drug:proton antiporter [Pseudomonas sp. FW306-02-F02-AB]PMZ09387.1 drug:proton antiporter [Pseudomonas sp. FW306-02-H06C]PMZ16551.1 drug:proton antiporter [Pseudomonas sp. FW306-02-F02-AA]PMZ21039.1 drug:proton antiporter [Pseudomonas sp. FW306-02-F08-AA]